MEHLPLAAKCSARSIFGLMGEMHSAHRTAPLRHISDWTRPPRPPPRKTVHATPHRPPLRYIANVRGRACDVAHTRAQAWATVAAGLALRNSRTATNVAPPSSPHPAAQRQPGSHVSVFVRARLRSRPGICSTCEWNRGNRWLCGHPARLSNGHGAESALVLEPGGITCKASIHRRRRVLA